MTKSHLRNTILTLLFAFLGYQSAFATHLIGGEMNYKCLGNNEYEISLTVYRDCFLGVAELDDTAYVAIFGIEDTLLQTVPILLKEIGTIFQMDECLFIPPNICVETTTYIDTVTLLHRPGGYEMAYQRCCRNETILNIVDPLNTGATYNISLTEEALSTCNSSPVLNEWPPTFVCVNRPLIFESGAKDTEEDSLVYRLCTPFDGGVPIDQPRPRPSAPPPFDTVVWKNPTYDLNNLLGGVPLIINPTTGKLTGTPNTIGQFVVGICVDEYREGVLLSTTKRDFQYNVVPCENIGAQFDMETEQCENFTIAPINRTEGNPDGFLWKVLDDKNTTILTSGETNPVFENLDTGRFIVRLIINPNGICVDSLDQNIWLYNKTLLADFQYDIIGCLDSLELQFTDKSSNSLGEIDSWLWTLTGEIDQLTSTNQNPKFVLNQSQEIKVQLQISTQSGCFSEKEIDLTAMIIPDSFSISTFDTLVVCQGDSIELNPIFNPELSYFWSPSNGLSSVTTPNPKAFPDTSTAYVVQIQDSSGNCSLLKNVFLEVIDFDNSFDFSIQTLTCGDSIQVQLLPKADYDLSTVQLTWTVRNNGQLWIFNSHSPIISYKNNAPLEVSATVRDGFGCSKTIQKREELTLIEVDFPTDILACIGDSIYLNPITYPEYIYQWSPETLFENPTQPNQKIVVQEDKLVTVNVMDSTTNCSIERRINISALGTILDADFDFKINHCIDSISLAITNVRTFPERLINKIHWELNGGIEQQTSNELLPEFSLKNSQFIELSAIINPNDNCPKTISKSFRVNLLEGLDLDNQLSICTGESVALNPNSQFRDYIYEWSSDEVIDDSNAMNPMVTPTESTTFKVVYSDSTQLCQLEEEVAVLVKDTLAAIDAEIKINCDGRTVSITPINDALIRYDFGNGQQLDTAVSGSFEYLYASSEDFEIRMNYSGENICPDTTLLTISLPEDNIVPNFEWNVENCDNNVASVELLDISISSTGKISNWNWQLSNGLSSSENEPVFTITKNEPISAKLIVMLDEEANCQDSITLEIPPLLIEGAFPDSIIGCAGDLVNLNPNISPENNFSWKLEGTSDEIKEPNPTITLEGLKIYEVEVSNEFGCIIEDSVITQAAPTIEITTLEIEPICDTVEVVLFAESEQADQLIWKNEDGETISNQPEIMVSIDHSQNFEIIFTDQYNCQNTAIVPIEFQPISLDYNRNQRVCQNENITLIINNLSNQNNLNFTWNPTDLIIDGGQTISPTANPEISTNFTFTATNPAGCEKEGSIFAEVLPLPEISATADPETIFNGETSQLGATDNSKWIYGWSPAESLDNGFSPTPLASPNATTNYSVNVVDENGCSSTTTVLVNVREVICDFPYIFVPSGFTPNGDGENDVLFVRGNSIENLEFVIYDRWGDKVFETTDQETGWDGTKNGRELPSGVFGYYLKVVCIDGQEFKQQGNVTLIR